MPHAYLKNINIVKFKRGKKKRWETCTQNPEMKWLTLLSCVICPFSSQMFQQVKNVNFAVISIMSPCGTQDTILIILYWDVWEICSFFNIDEYHYSFGPITLPMGTFQKQPMSLMKGNTNSEANCPPYAQWSSAFHSPVTIWLMCIQETSKV